MERKSFLDQDPPPGYIPGIGRGATGFITQADLGSTRKLPITSFEKELYDNDEKFKDSEKPFQLILSASEKEDLEANEIYDNIEKYLERKKNKKRKNESPTSDEKERNKDEENKLKAEEKSISSSIAQISEQFEDVKKELATVSVEEWENLPESGDFTRRNKRLRTALQERQRFYRNSDMITLDLKNSATDIALDDANAELDGDNNTSDNDNEDTSKKDDEHKDSVDLLQLTRTKDRLLETQLMLGNQKLNNTLDKNAYLESLNPSASQYNIGDYKRTRKLLSKLRETAPNNPRNWIASAKLEFDAKKFKRARQLIQEGCERCPKSEEIWLTNLEMNKNDIPTCKVIVADAIKYNFKSLKLWLKAVDFEVDNLSKTRILRKALEWLPNTADLWLAIVQFEDDKDISIKMLEKATTIIPDSFDLWVKLADMKPTNESIQTLLESTKYISKEKHYLVWLKIAKLEEKNTSNEVKINKYISKAFENSVFENENEWYSQAQICENEKLKLTCRSIVLKAVEHDTSDITKLLEKAKSNYDLGYKEISDALFLFMTMKYLDNLEIWKEYLIMKRKSKDFVNLFLIYEMAIAALPRVVELYIMYCNAIIKHNEDFDKIRDILSEGITKNPKSESLWLFIIDFETKYGTSEICRDLFDSCLRSLGDLSVKVWIKKSGFERRLYDYAAALETLSNAITKFPQEVILYQEKGEILIKLNEDEDAKLFFQKSIQNLSKNETLFVSLATLYRAKFNNIIKARSVLDEGLSKHPNSEIIHHSRVKLELDIDNKAHAQRLLSKAISLVPSSPLLWVDNIKLATKQQVKNMYALALKKTNDHPLIILTIAKDLWKSGKIDRAYRFFNACLDKDNDYGDGYIYYYAFLLKFGTREEMKNLEDEVLNKENLHGYVWTKVLKQNETRNVPELQLLRETAVHVSRSL
jgi:pre-mRNA-processing factor 6